MSESISLFDLLNVSIGTPHDSSVNFSALHALLLAVLKQLDIRGLKIQWGGSLHGETSPVTTDRQLEGEDEKVGAKAQRDVPESEQQVLPGTGQQKGLDGSPIPDPAAAILTRIQTCEGGVSEELELVQDLQKQKEGLMEKMEELHQQFKDADSQTRTEVEKCCHRVDTLENAVSSLRETLQKYPEPEKLSQSLSFVQSAQFNAHLSKGPTNTDVRDSNTPVETHSPTIRPPHTPPSSSPTEQGTTPAAPPEIANTSEASSEPPAQVKGDPDTTNADMDSFEKVSSSPWYQEMMVAVKTINKLQEKVTQLEICLLELEEHKIDQVQLAQLNELINNKGSVRHNMMAQLNQQKVFIEDLMSDRDKLDNLEEMVMTLTMKDRRSSSVPASESLDVESPAFDELKQHVLYLRKSLQKLEGNMKSLREQQVQLEERCSDQNLQDQLDDLRATIEATILSETTPMSSSLQDRSEEQGVSEITERSHQTSIPVDADSELSLLQQQHQQLQDVVNGLIQQLNRVKLLQLEERQAARNIGLVKDVQRAILQLQEDSEKLQKTTRILHEDSGHKQGLIEELYTMMEELEVKTTNMQTQEHKTQKTEGPVDVVKEQPETELQEFPKKVVLPEEGWQELFHRLSSEMETKVNRIEVDYLMLQLEKRWKTIEDKLEASELDNACLIKRELFHCLSCDRPVLMQVPGPIVNTLPSFPALPSHKSTRLLNADQPQDKRLKPGTSRYNCWMGTPGRKRVAFQRSYNDMCKQIDSMESGWRRQENWDNTNQNPAGVQHEWTSELMDNQAVPRSCGGSHANASGLQSTKLLTQTEADGMTQEIGIIGLDGHIYKDCLSIQALKNNETKLPTIATKDGMCKTRNKAKNSASQRRAVSLEVGQTTPVHQLPPSARSMQCSPSASSCSGRDWPVSALGCCTSQSSITHTSAAAESADDPQSDEPLNL